MVRAPCCEKMGLKKGPWTSEEDQILINYIRQYGHGNWRALPKLAGLLRCGKSCRLRWTNYLRPDIKRGNFSPEEEENIIKLHEMLGNRWSAIASRLPGRTDNEIKNVWHTHLKKRLIRHKHNTTQETKRQHSTNIISQQTQEAKKEEDQTVIDNKLFSSNNIIQTKSENIEYNRPVSPPQCSSETSSVTTGSNNSNNNDNLCMEVENFSEILDENFWSEVLSAENNSEVVNDFSANMANVDQELQFLSFSPLAAMEPVHGSNAYDSGMDFWYNIFTRAGETPELNMLPDF